MDDHLAVVVEPQIHLHLVVAAAVAAGMIETILKLEYQLRVE